VFFENLKKPLLEKILTLLRELCKLDDLFFLLFKGFWKIICGL